MLILQSLLLRTRINRNIVECKDNKRTVQNRSGVRINRNIVECKESTQGNLYRLLVRINRNIVECKVEKTGRSSVTESVLIETSWNVKTIGQACVQIPAAVLIETSWNVK